MEAPYTPTEVMRIFDRFDALDTAPLSGSFHRLYLRGWEESRRVAGSTDISEKSSETISYELDVLEHALRKHLGRVQYVFHPIANRGVVYAEKSLFPALIEMHDMYPDSWSEMDIARHSSKGKTGSIFSEKELNAEEAALENLSMQKEGWPLWQTFGRRDVHLSRIASEEPLKIRVADKPKELMHPTANVAVWYDDRIKTGETLVALAMFYAEHQKLLRRLDYILIAAHRDDAGISHVCEEPAWHPSVGHREFETFVRDSPRFGQYYEKLKRAGVFAKIPVINDDYAGKLRKHRLLDFLETSETTDDHALQLLTIGNRQALVSYNQRTQEVITRPDIDIIQKLLVQAGVPSLHDAGLQILSERHAEDLERFFGPANIPLYWPDKWFDEMLPKMKKKCGIEGKARELAAHMLSTGDIDPAMKEYGFADENDLVDWGLKKFAATIAPRIAGFERDVKGDHRILLLRPTEQSPASIYYQSLEHGFVLLGEGMNNLVTWPIDRFPDEYVDGREIVLFDAAEKPDTCVLESQGRLFLERGATGVRIVLTHKPDGSGAPLSPGIYAVGG